jgi:hypothetical protein
MRMVVVGCRREAQAKATPEASMKPLVMCSSRSSF